MEPSGIAAIILGGLSLFGMICALGYGVYNCITWVRRKRRVNIESQNLINPEASL